MAKDTLTITADSQYFVEEMDSILAMLVESVEKRNMLEVLSITKVVDDNDQSLIIKFRPKASYASIM